MSRKDFYVVACEHGGNRIPARYRHLFAKELEVLDTHEGFDDGALALAKDLARSLDAELFKSTTSRLLVDLNRSLSHPGIFSRFVRDLPPEERDRIVAKHYLPYRQTAETAVAQAVSEKRRVIHLSAHSFTPELDGEVRNADVGLLYDPSRKTEVALCHAWKEALKTHAPSLKVRFNYPYAGKSDGFVSWLRKCHDGRRYVGIEIEANQKHVSDAGHWRSLRRALIAALDDALAVITLP